ncbi:MAG: amino acid permease [Myxococcales bacterium]|nr:amino acid permease [Myxococcales bacterium]
MSYGKLGLGTAAALVIANIIGTGIFTSTGYQAQSLFDGGTMLVAWLVGGVLALAGAACYAELGAMMPRAGGEYVYLREAYHPAIGAMSGWVSLTAGFSAAIAVSALGFATYLGDVVPGIEAGLAQRLIAVGLVIAVTGMHSLDTVVGGRIQTIFTIAKVGLLVVFIVAGLAFGHGDWSHFAARAGGITKNVPTGAFAESLFWVGFAYTGWNAAAYLASELRDPQRTLPRALFIGTAGVIVLYLLVNVTFLYALSPEELGAPIVDVGAAAAAALFAPGVGKAMAVLVSLALVSSVSAMVMAGPRVYAAMAEDGALPAVLARRTARGVPAVAVTIQGVIAAIFILVGDLGKLIQYIQFTLFVSSALAVGAVYVLRVRQPDLPRPYRTTLYPLTPAVFLILAGWSIYIQVKAHPWGSAAGTLTLVVGGALYGLIELRKRPRPAPLPTATAID